MTQPDISAAFKDTGAITFGSNWDREVHLTQGGVDLDLSVHTGSFRAQMRDASAAGTTGAVVCSTQSADYGADATIAKITVAFKTDGSDGRYIISQDTLECRRLSNRFNNTAKTFFIEVELPVDGTPGADVTKCGKGSMSFLPETTVTEAAPTTPAT